MLPSIGNPPRHPGLNKSGSPTGNAKASGDFCPQPPRRMFLVAKPLQRSQFIRLPVQKSNNLASKHKTQITLYFGQEPLAGSALWSLRNALFGVQTFVTIHYITMNA